MKTKAPELDYSQYKTDKWRNHSYMEVYERIFANLRKRKVSLLEIGVYTGGCLCLWRDFFPEGSDIEGLDIHCTTLDRDKIGDIIVHDVDILEWSTNKVYDVIIDDASHEADQQAEAFKKLWKNISSDGIYVIEDVNKNLAPLIEDFVEENKIELEKYAGDPAFDHVGSGDCMFIFRREPEITSLTYWQRIARMIFPSRKG